MADNLIYSSIEFSVLILSELDNFSIVNLSAKLN